MTDIPVAQHKTPECSDAEWQKRKRATLINWYGDLIVKCGYCGGANHSGYVCDCGFQTQYNDDGVLVWSDK